MLPGGNTIPGRAKLPEYWPCREQSEMLPAKFKGSSVTETTRALVETGSQSCYRVGTPSQGEQNYLQGVVGDASRRVHRLEGNRNCLCTYQNRITEMLPGGNTIPGRAKLPEYWPCREYSEMLLSSSKARG